MYTNTKSIKKKDQYYTICSSKYQGTARKKHCLINSELQRFSNNCIKSQIAVTKVLK